MEHTGVKAMLSAGESTPESEEHLRHCASCAVWRESLERVRTLSVESAAPPMPSALVDRIITAVREAPTTAAVTTALAPRNMPWWRRVAGRVAIAAVLVGAVAVAALTLPDGSSNRSVLVASAAKTAATGTARVQYTGTVKATFTMTRLPAAPSIPNVPNIVPSMPQFPLIPEGVPDEVRDAFERSLADARRHVQESFDRAHESARRAEELARDAYRRSLERLGRPTQVEMRFEGTGEVVFPDKLHLKGTVRAMTPVPFPERSTFELIQIGRNAWIKLQLTEGKWVKIPEVDSPIHMMLQPGRVLDAMREVGADVRALGRETINGESLARYRGGSDFAVPASGGLSGRDELTLDVLIGSEDQILRRADLSGHSEFETPFIRSTHESSLRFGLGDFGADVDVKEPARGKIVDASALFSFGVFVFGFADGGFGFDVDFTPPSLPDLSRAPEFQIPDFQVPEFQVPEFKIPGSPSGPGTGGS